MADTLTYTYDLDGNTRTAADGAGTVTMTYDGNQLATRTDPFGLTLTYRYDLAGNVTSEADSLGGLTTEIYDGNQMASMTYQDAATQLRSDFTYDGDGNVLTITRYSDAAGIQVDGQTTYAYDGGQVTSIVSEDGSGDVLQTDAYAYDAAGRVSSQTDNGVLTVYAYDATGQLTSDGTTQYTYDANGNRTIAGYVTGVDNELKTDGTWNYTYDAEGNTITKVNIATGETWTYGYDLNNRLVSAVDRQADGTLIQEATYEYDALGDRIEESVTVGALTTVTNYAFDAAGNVWCGSRKPRLWAGSTRNGPLGGASGRGNGRSGPLYTPITAGKWQRPSGFRLSARTPLVPGASRDRKMEAKGFTPRGCSGGATRRPGKPRPPLPDPAARWCAGKGRCRPGRGGSGRCGSNRSSGTGGAGGGPRRTRSRGPNTPAE